MITKNRENIHLSMYVVPSNIDGPVGFVRSTQKCIGPHRFTYFTSTGLIGAGRTASSSDIFSDTYLKEFSKIGNTGPAHSFPYFLFKAIDYVALAMIIDLFPQHRRDRLANNKEIHKNKSNFE